MISKIVLLVVILQVLENCQSFERNSEGGNRWIANKQFLSETPVNETKENNSKRFDKIRFFLYTANNPTEPIEIEKDEPLSLVRSTFNFKNPTRFMIHGWNGQYNLSESRLIREALLLQGSEREFNFIAVDWSVYAKSNLYVSSQKSVSKAGKMIAEFIDWMHDNAKLSFNTLALYGHSLGAHVAGFTGKNVQRGVIHTIIGLDPALPLFNYNKPETRLAHTDASYVETIHTNGGGLGFYQPIGKASFYPNGGKYQPGCGLDMSCSHCRSVEYLAEALAEDKDNKFDALHCKDVEDFKNVTSSCAVSKFGVKLGHSSNARYANGIYYLKTNSQSPYGVQNSFKS